jgi:hypothetical protein
MFIDFVSLEFVALIFNVECAYKKSKLPSPTYYLEYLANAYEELERFIDFDF